MTFREFECALGWEIAGRYNEEIHSALLRPPVAVWREHEASLAVRTPKDRMAFWVSFLPDAHRTLRPDGIWLHDIPYWSMALSGQVGRAKSELLIKFDPRDVSRIFVQHPDGRFLESVREHHLELHSFRVMRRMEASLRKASALRLRHSQSLASLRHRPSQAKVRSTIHRLGKTTKRWA